MCLCLIKFRVGQRLSCEKWDILNQESYIYPPLHLLVGLVTKGVKVAPVLVAFQSELSQLPAAAAQDFEQQEIWAHLIKIY